MTEVDGGSAEPLHHAPASYKVVVNDEEQYSLLPAERDNPAGWNDTGTRGTKEECLAHIRDVWTDMRPLGLRRKTDTAMT